MPAPRKGSLITIFVPKPHSSHVFGPRTILGLSGSDLISLQFGHFLYFLPEIWVSQNKLAIKLYGDSCFASTYMLFVCFVFCCIDPVLHKTLGSQSYCLTSNSIQAGRPFLFTNVLISFLSITFSSDYQFLPLYHQIYAVNQIFTSLVFSNILPPAARCNATQAGSHLLRYPLQQHKPNVCPIKSISNPNRDGMLNLDQSFMRHHKSIKEDQTGLDRSAC